MGDVVGMKSHPHVVIDFGTVTGSTDPSDVGKRMFFVEYHDETGRVIGDYSGSSYDDAMRAAKAWDVSVFDKTAA